MSPIPKLVSIRLILTICVLCAALPSFSVQARSSALLVLGSEEIRLDGRQIDGNFYIRASSAASRLGYAIERDKQNDVYIILYGGHRIMVRPGSSRVYSEGRETTLSRPALRKYGELYLPPAFFENPLGRLFPGGITWDPATNRLLVSVTDATVQVRVASTKEATRVMLDLPSGVRAKIERRFRSVEIDLSGRPFQIDLPPDSRAAHLKEVRFRPSSVQGGALTLELSERDLKHRVTRPSQSGDNTLIVDLYREALPVEPVRSFPRKRRVKTLVIDPGHGGVDSGVTSATGQTEKTIALNLAKGLSSGLASKGLCRVELSRTSDTNISPEERTATANHLKADLLICLHTNWSVNSGKRGITVVVYGEEPAASSESIDSKSTGDRKEGLIPWSFAQYQNLEESREFAALLETGLSTELPEFTVTSREAPLAVLRGAAMPAIHLEVGYLSNVEESVLLTTDYYRQQLLKAVSAALESFWQGERGENRLVGTEQGWKRRD